MKPRAVIVTGASRGVGKAVALAFLQQGDEVVLVSRDAAELQAVVASAGAVEQPQRAGGGDSGSAPSTVTAAPVMGKAHVVAADLSTPGGCEACMDEALRLLGGRLDVLINNAGSGTLGCSLQSTTIEQWDKHMAIDLTAPFLLTQRAVEPLSTSKGCIVNLASIASVRPFKGMLPYCVAKAGFDMLTKCSALELAPKGVRVNAVAPATVRTTFHEHAGMGAEQADKFYADAAEVHPLGRIGLPSDISSLVVFLADNDKAGWLTGQTVVADGGRLLTTPAGAGLQK